MFEALSPLIGMALLGGVLGWLVGRAFAAAARAAFLALLIFIALQLIGYKLAVVHWGLLTAHARELIEQSAPWRRVLWGLMRYNLPFTLGFLAGFWHAVRRPRGRR